MTKPYSEMARDIRLKIADGIFNQKWSAYEVDEKETQLIAKALCSVWNEAIDKAADKCVSEEVDDHASGYLEKAIRSMRKED